mmetsp:Transcript_160216/g.514008  ORF Transcript_160216/g.514008 Transcript_160216/m.514008 type:complete len:214 (+) Transcript_160216:1-642(+)
MRSLGSNSSGRRRRRRRLRRPRTRRRRRCSPNCCPGRSCWWSQLRRSLECREHNQSSARELFAHHVEKPKQPPPERPVGGCNPRYPQSTARSRPRSNSRCGRAALGGVHRRMAREVRRGVQPPRGHPRPDRGASLTTRPGARPTPNAGPPDARPRPRGRPLSRAPARPPTRPPRARAARGRPPGAKAAEARAPPWHQTDLALSTAGLSRRKSS